MRDLSWSWSDFASSLLCKVLEVDGWIDHQKIKPSITMLFWHSRHRLKTAMHFLYYCLVGFSWWKHQFSSCRQHGYPENGTTHCLYSCVLDKALCIHRSDSRLCILKAIMDHKNSFSVIQPMCPTHATINHGTFQNWTLTESSICALKKNTSRYCSVSVPNLHLSPHWRRF